jgi:hypothetical protein
VCAAPICSQRDTTNRRPPSYAGWARRWPWRASPHAPRQGQLASLDGAASLTPGQLRMSSRKGEASIPREAPAVVKRALEAGNLIHSRPRRPLRQPRQTLARLRLLRRDVLSCSMSAGFGQSRSTRLHRPRELRRPWTRPVDHRLRQRCPRMDRRRRHRARHRRLRRPPDPRRHRPALALRTPRQPRRRHQLRRTPSARPVRQLASFMAFKASALGPRALAAICGQPVPDRHYPCSIWPSRHQDATPPFAVQHLSVSSGLLLPGLA